MASFHSINQENSGLNSSNEMLKEEDLIVPCDRDLSNPQQQEKTTYEKMEAFFEKYQTLKNNNFKEFLNSTELNQVIKYTNINTLWEHFLSLYKPSDNANRSGPVTELEFGPTIDLVEKLLEEISDNEPKLPKKDEIYPDSDDNAKSRSLSPRSQE